jgi:hypothetical protein
MTRDRRRERRAGPVSRKISLGRLTGDASNVSLAVQNCAVKPSEHVDRQGETGKQHPPGAALKPGIASGSERKHQHQPRTHMGKNGGFRGGTRPPLQSEVNQVAGREQKRDSRRGQPTRRPSQAYSSHRALPSSRGWPWPMNVPISINRAAPTCDRTVTLDLGNEHLSAQVCHGSYLRAHWIRCAPVTRYGGRPNCTGLTARGRSREDRYLSWGARPASPPAPFANARSACALP